MPTTALTRAKLITVSPMSARSLGEMLDVARDHDRFEAREDQAILVAPGAELGDVLVGKRMPNLMDLAGALKSDRHPVANDAIKGAWSAAASARDKRIKNQK